MATSIVSRGALAHKLVLLQSPPSKQTAPVVGSRVGAVSNGMCFCSRRSFKNTSASSQGQENGHTGAMRAINRIKAAGSVGCTSAVATLASLILPSSPASAAVEQVSVEGESLNALWQLADLDPSTAKLLITILGPVFAISTFLFIIRIVMSWYPQLPATKFPYVVAYAPTEPVLGPTRKLIPPIGGVDISPVLWLAFISFSNEVLLGQQGLLVLLAEKRLGSM